MQSVVCGIGTLFSERMLFFVAVDSTDDNGEPVCFNQFTIFAGGAGGFGGKRSSPHAKVQHAVHQTKCVDASELEALTFIGIVSVANIIRQSRRGIPL